MHDQSTVKVALENAGKALSVWSNRQGGIDGFKEQAESFAAMEPRDDMVFQAFDSVGDDSGEYTKEQFMMLDFVKSLSRRLLDECDKDRLTGLRYLADHPDEVDAFADVLAAKRAYRSRVCACVEEVGKEMAAQRLEKERLSQELEPSALIRRIEELEKAQKGK